MTASITETLMGLGSSELELEPDPDLYAELVEGPDGAKRDGRVLLIYWAEHPEPFAHVKVEEEPSRDAIHVYGVGLEWYLGDSDIGPTEIDKIYVAGTNKLANPKFLYTFTEESTDDVGDPTTRVTADNWKLAQKTGWLIAEGTATVTDALHAALAGLADIDPNLSLPSDILTSDESFEVLAGDLLVSELTARRLSGSVGRLRNRLVFDGHFRHPNLLAPLSDWTIDPATVSGDAHIYTAVPKRVEIGPVTREVRVLNSWTNTSPYSGDLIVGSWLTLGPCTQPQFLSDPSFESGFAYWLGNTGTDPGSGFPNWDNYASYPWGGGTILPHSGANMVGCGAAPTDTGEEVRYLESLNFVSVQPGERYLLEGYIAEGPVTIGDATVYLVPIPGVGVQRWIPSQSVHGRHLTAGPTSQQWKKCHLEYSVPPGIVELAVLCYATFDRATWPGVATPAGLFFFDDVTLTRINGNVCSADSGSFSVIAGDTYEITSQAFANSDVKTGEMVMAITLSGPGQPDVTVKSNPITQDNTALTNMRAVIQPDAGYTAAKATITGRDIVGGSMIANLPTVVRTVGNIAKVTAPPISIVPEEQFTVAALITADAGVTQGTVGVSFLCQSPGRPDQVIDGPAFDASAITPQGLRFEFATPSGYDTVTASLVGTDILGGKFTVGPPTFSLTDPKRLVEDIAAAPGGAGENTYVQEVATPIGAEHVHLELVAEDKADGFVVTATSVRRGETPWASGDVARDLLRDPANGRQLVQPGTIVGDEGIRWDWHTRHLTQRAKLQHLSRSGLATPVREWRFHLGISTGKPTMDWGLPEAIFADRTDLIFVDDDLKLIDPPQVRRSGANRVTSVTVVGADRQRPDGPPTQITGSATNPNTDLLDWDGNPLNRTKTVPDSSANHPDYAAALARYQADLALTPAENVRMRVSDLRAWAEKGLAHVGDWIYVYKPDAGIVDLARAMQYLGRTIWPKRLRIISWTWRLGSGDFRLEVHRPGLSRMVVDPNLVRWESETTAELELGDPLPDFSPDQEGGPALDQLRLLRSSMPRR